MRFSSSTSIMALGLVFDYLVIGNVRNHSIYEVFLRPFFCSALLIGCFTFSLPPPAFIDSFSIGDRLGLDILLALPVFHILR